MIAPKIRTDPAARGVGLAGRRSQPKQSKGTDIFIDHHYLNEIFGLNLVHEEVPQYPILSMEEMAISYSLGHFMLLSVSRTTARRDMTIDNMQFQFSNRLGPGKLLHDYKLYEGSQICYDPNWCARERFFFEHTPKVEYRSFSSKFIPGSVDADYFVQTEAIADYLRSHVYKNRKLPVAYADAVQEFESKKNELREMIKMVEWDICARHFVNLKLNRWFRPTPVEMVYAAAVYFTLNRKPLLEDGMHVTAVRPSFGDIVSVGSFDLEGALITHNKPSHKDKAAGVIFSCPVDPDVMVLSV